MGKYYVTTTLPYVNAEPHVGFALEIVRADVLARAHRLSGDEVVFNTGTDEHGQKIYQKALEENKSPQEYCDEYAEKFKLLKQALNLTYTHFVRTTDERHIKAAREFWKRCGDSGDIYKKEYSIKYCVGCELEKTDSELMEGKCPLHPTKEIELRSEENYFFKFSKYQESLLELFKNNADFVSPRFRGEEIQKFISQGLQDFSISRVKEKMPWGVPVPNDDTQVMYVWFDALVNYISTLGWPDPSSSFDTFWPGVQLCGKDNLRQQSAMWQAMLMSAGVENTKNILVGGFITADGQKMSKSLGNVINPIDYVEKYGTDALRYYLLARISVNEDSDMTRKSFEEVYQADLANGLSNLCARVSSMAEKAEVSVDKTTSRFNEEYLQRLDRFEFSEVMESIWERIRSLDKIINERELWKMEGEKKAQELATMIMEIRKIACDLQPFLPETAEKMMSVFDKEQVSRGENLFWRLDSNNQKNG